MAVVSVVLVTLYAGITYTFATVRVSRESLQATQLLQSKMEVVRLYNWNQVTTNNFIPSSFQEIVYAPGMTNNGVTYSGTVTVRIPTVVGHPFRFISDSHSNSKRTPVPIDIGQ